VRQLAVSVLACALVGMAREARAQRGAEATISIRVFGGSTLSQPVLWDIGRQPMLVPGTENTPVYDTLHLSRTLSPGLVVGLGMTYFPTALLGVDATVSFVGLETDMACSGVTPFYQLGLRHDNEQLCSSIQGQSQALHAMFLGAGGVARIAPRRGISPYVRADIGVLVYNASTVYVAGTDPTGTRVVVDDPHPRSLAICPTVAVGATVALGPDYQFRFELADMAAGLQRVTGPADLLLHAPTGTRFVSNAVFTFGLDVVLAGKPGRRY
jgi:hypothetical protein